ncbi:TPA: ash family protein [Salmonella enterica subsp. diarizonae serovar 60-67:z35:-]
MVAQAGQPSGWPVSCQAGFSPLFWAITMSVRTPMMACYP